MTQYYCAMQNTLRGAYSVYISKLHSSPLLESKHALCNSTLGTTRTSTLKVAFHAYVILYGFALQNTMRCVMRGAHSEYISKLHFSPLLESEHMHLTPPELKSHTKSW